MISRSCREEVCLNLSTHDSFKRLFDLSFGSLRFGDETKHCLEIRLLKFGGCMGVGRTCQ